MLPERFSNVPIAAFTATATHRVQEDIITKIGLRSPFKIRASFDRPNLFYQVKKKNKVDRQIIEFLKERPHESGIVYRTTRDAVDDTAANLQNEGISSLPYHAGLVAEERRKCQEAFNKDEVQVIVATIAFGMGIDKSNVRFVIHADLPKNIEGYYQETGRSGRDGEPAVCLLLFGLGDIPKIRYFIDDITDSEQQAIARQKLNQMVAYGRHWVCRRKQLLAYFGETYDEENCKTCDVCVGDAKWIDITTDAQMVLSAVVRTGQRFGAMHISDIVVGGNTQRIRQWGHDKIKTYGVGKDKSRQHWRFVIEELVAQGILNQEDARYRVLTLNPSAAEVLKGNCVVKTIEMQDIENRKMMQPKEEMAYNETLFERLRQLRRRLAQEQQVPPFIIFSDRTLHEMCRYYPSTLSELGRISGVGEVKMDRYGDAFVNEIAEFLAENPDVQ